VENLGATASGILIRPKIGSNEIVVKSDPCELNWDTSGATIGHVFGYQIKYQVPGNRNYVTADFILEIVSEPPVCVFSEASDTGRFFTYVGGTLSFDISVSDPKARNVRLETLPTTLHPGMSFSPAAGSSQTVPVTFTFTYSPASADAGLSYSFSSLFVNTDGVMCSMSINIGVREAPPSPPPYR
jgi:hypothetical protein